MKSSSATSVLLAAAAAIAATSGFTARAQPGAGGGEPSLQQEKTIALSFSGGTLAKFVAALRKAGDANIVMGSLAEEVELPAIELKGASVYSALNAVGSIVPDSYGMQVQRQGGPNEATVYAVRVAKLRPGQQVGSSSDDTHVEVYSLRDLIEDVNVFDTRPQIKMDAQTILTAIDAGLGVGGRADRATLRYHEESGLVFVKGTRAQTGMVSTLLRTMGSDLEKRRRAADQRAMMELQKQKQAEQREKAAAGSASSQRRAVLEKHAKDGRKAKSDR